MEQRLASNTVPPPGRPIFSAWLALLDPTYCSLFPQGESGDGVKLAIQERCFPWGGIEQAGAVCSSRVYSTLVEPRCVQAASAVAISPLTLRVWSTLVVGLNVGRVPTIQRVPLLGPWQRGRQTVGGVSPCLLVVSAVLSWVGLPEL